jgi:hypothetical protein
MGASPPSRLTPFQTDLLREFFAREQRLFLTGGGALAGFYFGHRDTEDLDLFSPPGLDLGDAARAMGEAAAACGAVVTPLQTYADFRRLLATRGEERCLVDLVIDRAAMVDPDKARFGQVRVDTLREIASNKICTVLSRSEVKDLIDLQLLLGTGLDLRDVLRDAHEKDLSADPTALGWVLDQITISPRAALPGGADPVALDLFRRELVKKLRDLAFEQVRR